MKIRRVFLARFRAAMGRLRREAFPDLSRPLLPVVEKILRSLLRRSCERPRYVGGLSVRRAGTAGAERSDAFSPLRPSLILPAHIGH